MKKTVKLGRTGRPTKRPGIGRHAKLLGVTRQHLTCVLEGERKSLLLMDRYYKLLDAERYRQKKTQAT